MNGEDLVYDYRHFVVDPPTEWAFNWEYSEGGTNNPVAKDHHATLFVVMNLEGDPIDGIRAMGKIVEQHEAVKFQVTPPADEEDEATYTFEFKTISTKETIITGQMEKQIDDLDANVGNYAIFHCDNPRGMEIMERMFINNTSYGRVALIRHTHYVKDIGAGYRLDVTNGDGEDKKGLATRFRMFHADEEVARCHMTYRDGSFDASMGPTLEMIAVKQSRRGEGLAKVLWYQVRRFIEIHFTIECLNTIVPPGHVMIKATQVGTNLVEVRKDKDGKFHPMTFKEFLYDYCGFSVREQKGVVAFMLASKRPKDEEAMLFIPLLKPGEPSPMKQPKVGSAIYREKIGARMCLYCSKVSIKMNRCSRCEVAFYCGRDCQVADWKNRHKLWCNKSREEVETTMIERGDLQVEANGVKKIMMTNSLYTTSS